MSADFEARKVNCCFVALNYVLVRNKHIRYMI